MKVLQRKSKSTWKLCGGKSKWICFHYICIEIFYDFDFFFLLLKKIKLLSKTDISVHFNDFCFDSKNVQFYTSKKVYTCTLYTYTYKKSNKLWICMYIYIERAYRKLLMKFYPLLKKTKLLSKTNTSVHFEFFCFNSKNVQFYTLKKVYTCTLYTYTYTKSNKLWICIYIYRERERAGK